MSRADVMISPLFWRMNRFSHAATNTRARSIVREFTPETYPAMWRQSRSNGV